ncbi:MAG: glucose-6-phosphate isomerase [Hyphomonadaceae bacterium]
MSESAFDREAERLLSMRLSDLFARDPARAADFTFAAPHMTLDVSRERVDKAALAVIEAMAEAADLAGWRDRMFAGDIVNITEGRAARHVALRSANPPDEVREVRARMRALAQEIASGGEIDAILHVGIGGSDLGPRLVLDALKPYRRANFQVRFAANVDGADFADAVEGLDPARTLVVLVSKTFTTLETLFNAGLARAWLGPHASARFAAVTAAPQRAAEWGVPAERIFPFWDWVGGRYSLWSAVGLSVEIALQDGAFDRLLAGAAEMDAHFRDAPFAQNAPFIAAAVQTWRREALERGSYALVPYAHRLALLPAWAQQLEMESNGKFVTREGDALDRPAAAVTWGAVGANAQHSFFQMLHQGVDEIPVDFVLVKDAGGEGRTSLLANALAQAQALMHGKTEEAAFADMRAAGLSEEDAARLAPHRAFPGDRASSILALDDLSPESLGALLAFYEHRIVAQAFLAGVNPFDQFGVELGKDMAGRLAPALEGKSSAPEDPTTAAWIARLKR